MWIFSRHKLELPAPDQALRGRSTPIVKPGRHLVTGLSLEPPYPEGSEVADFALGCFWGAERKFWQTPGVLVTAAGYQGGFTPNPTYEEVCSGMTGHAEAVRVVFDPKQVSYDELLKVFWEEHDPTQGMRQGNDVGTQYRSEIYVSSDLQRQVAEESRRRFQEALTKARLGHITTQVRDATEFYFAEDYHQQYLERHPNGYCGLGGTGVACPVGIAKTEPAT